MPPLWVGHWAAGRVHCKKSKVTPVTRFMAGTKLRSACQKLLAKGQLSYTGYHRRGGRIHQVVKSDQLTCVFGQQPLRHDKAAEITDNIPPTRLGDLVQAV